MLYVNQREYESVPYYTNLQEPESLPATKGNIKMSGCGICSAMMVVDRLTAKSISLEECIQLSYDVKANMDPGTDMKILGPAIAERFDLTYDETDNFAKLRVCLRDGGCAIVNVGGDHDDHKGVFSHYGHFMVIIADEMNRWIILDPNLYEGEYDGTDVIVKDNLLYCNPRTVLGDTANRSPAFYLFRRKPAPGTEHDLPPFSGFDDEPVGVLLSPPKKK